MAGLDSGSRHDASLHPSDDRCTTVDGDELTGQETGQRAEQELDYVGDIRRLALSLKGNHGELLVAGDESGDLRLGNQT